MHGEDGIDVSSKTVHRRHNHSTSNISIQGKGDVMACAVG